VRGGQPKDAWPRGRARPRRFGGSLRCCLGPSRPPSSAFSQSTSVDSVSWLQQDHHNVFGSAVGVDYRFSRRHGGGLRAGRCGRMSRRQCGIAFRPVPAGALCGTAKVAGVHRGRSSPLAGRTVTTNRNVSVFGIEHAGAATSIHAILRLLEAATEYHRRPRPSRPLVLPAHSPATACPSYMEQVAFAPAPSRLTTARQDFTAAAASWREDREVIRAGRRAGHAARPASRGARPSTPDRMYRLPSRRCRARPFVVNVRRPPPTPRLTTIAAEMAWRTCCSASATRRRAIVPTPRTVYSGKRRVRYKLVWNPIRHPYPLAPERGWGAKW